MSTLLQTKKLSKEFKSDLGHVPHGMLLEDVTQGGPQPGGHHCCSAVQAPVCRRSHRRHRNLKHTF